MQEHSMTTCNIHSIESMAARDGDGVRCAVFFCGCPLRCVYCHNPDTWHVSGIEMTPEALAKKIIRFKPYFSSNGGATFSGGEPLLHAEFINETNIILAANGVKYMLDTSGCVDLTDDVKEAVRNADGIILDLKFYNSDGYTKYCRGNFERVHAFASFCTSEKKRMLIRTVVVPGINDTEEDMVKYAATAKQFKFESYELLPFHTMGFFKYEELGIENLLAGTSALSRTRLDELQSVLNSML
ncbi:MAG: radical SAM protein [Clostridia bacterium]|nr:radical SAM protein [Clostridia bacterium]